MLGNMISDPKTQSFHNVIFLFFLLLHAYCAFGEDCSESGYIKKVYQRGESSKAVELMLKDTACTEESRRNWLVFLIDQDDTLNLRKILRQDYPSHYDNGQLSGRTVLHSACFFKKSIYARILLENGADINHADANNVTPFLEAVRHGYDFCEPFFNYDPDINIVSWNGDTPLLVSCQWNRTKLALKLISKGAQINVQNKNGHSPLMAAVSNNNFRLAATLLSNGADIGLKDKNGNSILFFAINKGDIDLIELLIGKGAEINAKNNYGANLIISAVYQEKGDLAKYFIEKGVSLNIKNVDGESAFMFTANNRNSQIAKLLIQNGADIEAKDKYGRNALDKAIEKNNSDMVAYFRRLGLTERKFYSGLTSAQVQEIIENSEIDKIARFTKGLADTSFSNGVTPLHMAADLSNIAAIRALVAKGARPNPINGFGLTPLMFCIKKRNIDCIEYLLSLNIPVDSVISAYHSETAIYEAIKTKDVRIVKKILDYGANVNITNYDDVSPLDLATCKSTKEIVSLIFANTYESLLRNPNKYSPYDYAKKYCANDENAQYVKKLIESKYGKDITNKPKH